MYERSFSRMVIANTIACKISLVANTSAIQLIFILPLYSIFVVMAFVRRRVPEGSAGEMRYPQSAISPPEHDRASHP